MATWDEFVGADPAFGHLAQERIERDGLVLVHTIVSDKAGTEGDVKVYGRALAVEAPDQKERYCVALEARIGWRPEGYFHLFAVDITEVGYFVVADGGHRTRTWRPS